MNQSSKKHVYPVNDLAPHNTDGEVCPCNPKSEGDLIIHNSFDRREVLEKFPYLKKYLSLFLKDYRDYLKNDKSLEKDSVRIRLQTYNEFLDRLEEINERE